MLITVEVSEDFAAEAANLGLSPEAYARELLEKEQTVEAAWIGEAQRRAGEIDAGVAKFVSWEQIEARLRSRIAT